MYFVTIVHCRDEEVCLAGVFLAWIVLGREWLWMLRTNRRPRKLQVSDLGMFGKKKKMSISSDQIFKLFVFLILVNAVKIITFWMEHAKVNW